MHRMVLDHQFLGRPPQVPQEPLRHLDALDHAPEHGRQKPQRIVAAPSPEFLAEPPRPVLRAHLPAVEMHRRQPAAAMRRLADRLQQGLDERREMRVQAALSNLSDSNPRPGTGAGRVVCPVMVRPNRMIVQFPAGTSQTSRPLVDFRIPRSCPARCTAPPASSCGRRSETASRRAATNRERGSTAPFHPRRESGNRRWASERPAPRRRGKNSFHTLCISGVSVPSPKNGVRGCGCGSGASKCVGPVTCVSLATRCCMDCSGLTHGPPVPHQPGPAPSAISSPSRSASWIACPTSSRHGALMNSTGPRGMPTLTSRMMAPADARPLHGFQVGGHPLAREVAVHEHPVDPRPGGNRRTGKVFLQFRRRSRASGPRSQQQDGHETNGDFFHCQDRMREYSHHVVQCGRAVPSRQPRSCYHAGTACTTFGRDQRHDEFGLQWQRQGVWTSKRPTADS